MIELCLTVSFEGLAQEAGILVNHPDLMAFKIWI